jgi:hypothetical protein
MRSQFVEHITKAHDHAMALFDDLRGAHAKSEGAAELLLEDLLEQAAKIRTKLKRLADCVKREAEERAAESEAKG